MKFKQVAQIEDMLVKDETTYIYENELGQWVQLSMTKTPWTFKIKINNNLNVKPKEFIEAWEMKACHQNDYKGGYEEAISVIEISK
mgnify:CR=1 FL=1|tara:strand:+ start:3446 stop:3703 length:258 start_codon:yes stop_codon:yes gene_type:complete